MFSLIGAIADSPTRTFAPSGYIRCDWEEHHGKCKLKGVLYPEEHRGASSGQWRSRSHVEVSNASRFGSSRLGVVIVCWCQGA